MFWEFIRNHFCVCVCVFVPCSLPCPIKMFAAKIWTRLINTLATEQWIATKNVALFSATAWKFFYFGTQRISEQCDVEYWCLTFSVNCLVGFDNCNHIPFDVLHFLASLSSQENMGILCCFFLRWFALWKTLYGPFDFKINLVALHWTLSSLLCFSWWMDTRGLSRIADLI